MKLIIDDNNKWNYQKQPKGIAPALRDNLIRYLNSLSVVFEVAKSTSEFEFIFTILRVRGLSGPGWDSFDTTEEIFELISKTIDKTKNYKTHRYLSLWLYGHIIEASELYEILASLLKICDGGRFGTNNFPDKKRGKHFIPVSPAEKIDKIQELAKEVNLEEHIFSLNEIFDRELRNAIFHSDYSLFNGELHLNKQNRILKNENFVEIINKSFAYYMAFSNLIRFHISSYKAPKIVKVHPDFSSDPNETAITIIREGTGLVGIKDHFKSPGITDEYVSYKLGRFLKGELELINQNPEITTLPRNKRDRANRILKYFPLFLRKKLVKYLQTKI